MEIDLNKYTIWQDSREQENSGKKWDWPNMIREKLPTGDYTIKGFETILTIERKNGTGELATNVFERRFQDELDRLEQFKYSFIIIGCNFEDLVLFPENSGIPRNVWPKLKVNAGILMKKVSEWSLKYRTKIMFAGAFGKNLAESIFKRVLEIELLK